MLSFKIKCDVLHALNSEDVMHSNSMLRGTWKERTRCWLWLKYPDKEEMEYSKWSSQCVQSVVVNITMETTESHSYMQAFKAFTTCATVPTMSLNMDSHAQKWRHRRWNPHLMTAFDFCEIMASWCCRHSLLPLQSVIVFQLLGRKHTHITETQASRKKRQPLAMFIVRLHCCAAVMCGFACPNGSLASGPGRNIVHFAGGLHVNRSFTSSVAFQQKTSS